MRYFLWLLLLFPTLASAQQSPKLWNNVAAGMSTAQVRAAQPMVTIPADSSTLASGAKCELQIATLNVASDDYRVCFYFLNGKLTQVTLNAAGEPSMSQFQAIVTALRAKYGKELSNERTPLGYDVDWITPEGVNVGVIYINTYMKVMNVNYQLRLAQDANKI